MSTSCRQNRAEAQAARQQIDSAAWLRCDKSRPCCASGFLVFACRGTAGDRDSSSNPRATWQRSNHPAAERDLGLVDEQPDYLEALARGEMRRNLDGSPAVEPNEVTRQRAAKRLSKSRARPPVMNA